MFSILSSRAVYHLTVGKVKKTVGSRGHYQGKMHLVGTIRTAIIVCFNNVLKSIFHVFLNDQNFRERERELMRISYTACLSVLWILS